MKKTTEDTPIWEIIQHEFINLGKESIVKKEFSSTILSKYPHIKKGTLSAQIAIQVINKRSRTNYNQCGKERVCGDNKFDFLFEQEDKTLCKYDKSKHGTWEIYKRDDGKLDVRIILTTSIDHTKVEVEKIVEKIVEVEEEDDNKGYPGIRVRNFKDKEGNKDAKKQKLVSKYMMNWHEPTEEYNGRLGITARIPDFFESINKNCPKWTSDEITNIKNYITKYKVIPTLRYAPEEFTNWTKQVWWLAPFVFVEGPEGEIASWLFIDKNGFYVAHPSDNDSSPIFSWDNITDMDTEWLEDNLVMLTLYSEQNDKDIELRICEFVSEGNGSYLEVIESIHSIYEKTIEESRGSSVWSHGTGGEGYEGFDNPKELLDEKKWKAVKPTNPSMYGSSFEEIKTIDQKENGSNTKEISTQENLLDQIR